MQIAKFIMDHKYTLEKYSGNNRFNCPNCNKPKIFCRYVNKETNEYLHESVGRCNRENSCGYHYTPKQYFFDYNIVLNEGRINKPYSSIAQIQKPKIFSCIPKMTFLASLKFYDTNNFVKYLNSMFEITQVDELLSKYYIGSSKLWDGASVFWQIDQDGKIRTGKIMLYNSKTGKRVKEPFNHINWVHKALRLSDYELEQCFFGQHLLSDLSKSVAIVESEKTAIIASLYYPNYIWLATGSLSNLSSEKFKVLKGRNVVLFPDLNGYEKWKLKAKELSNIAKIYVSDFLEKNASKEDYSAGLDIADYLIRLDRNEFSASFLD
jgi:hypothetical protein